MTLELIGVEGIPEVRSGDDLSAMIAEHAALRDGDVIAVAQKVVSKAEGRLRSLSDVSVTTDATVIAHRLGSDPRMVQVTLDESVAVLRLERVLVVETRQGFVCANAGIDRSNVPGDDVVCLLPEDCDASARVMRERLRAVAGVDVAVIVSDTFGRAWRNGLCNVALGVAGMPALLDYRGLDDDWGRPLVATQVAIADELAAAAELVMGKTRRVPAVIARGLSEVRDSTGSGRDLVRPRELDLFR
ncbi:MAG: coenzyme F420-0:L-glutamate ligase [Candidatus Dormibacteraeota bacterium]|nr:coenzyme F420-0:L-glutamate ligase [Candidatus Dormibacteraeota bacterium]